MLVVGEQKHFRFHRNNTEKVYDKTSTDSSINFSSATSIATNCFISFQKTPMLAWEIGAMKSTQAKGNKK